MRLHKIFVLAFLLVGLQVHAASAQYWNPFQTPENRRLAAQWVNGLSTFLASFCQSISCEINRSKTWNYLVMSTDKVAIPLPDKDHALVVDHADLTASKEGVPYLNGLPQTVDIAVSGVALSRPLAERLAQQLSGGDAVKGRYIYNYISTAKLTAKASLAVKPDSLTLHFELSINEADTVFVTVDYPFSQAIGRNLVKEVVRADDIDKMGDDDLRGLTLAQSIDLSKFAVIPAASITVQFHEAQILDKFYVGVVAALSSSGEAAIWREFVDGIRSASSSQTSASFQRVASFFQNWRSNDHTLVVTVADPTIGAVARYGANVPDWSKTNFCTVGTLVGAALGFVGPSAIYPFDKDEFSGRALTNYVINLDVETQPGPARAPCKPYTVDVTVR